jgi:hypothetical protein
VVRALGQAIVKAPITAIAMVRIAPGEAGVASGMFNMMRHLGGAIGICPGALSNAFRPMSRLNHHWD